jgi:polysaccharide export outer membrane protein
VAGDVTRPGGFPLTDFDNISVIQALSMAGGPLRTAVRKNAVIIRRDAQGNRLEQKVDLGRVLKGQNPDVMLGANDILFVPGSASKAAALRTLESSIQMATGMLIYNRPF